MLLVSGLMFGSSLYAGNTISQKTVKQRQSLENSNIPTYIEFVQSDRIALSDMEGFFKQYYKSENNFSFREIGREEDQLGFVHIRYEQQYNGNGIELAEVIAHTKNGVIHSLNGKLLDRKPSQTEKVLSEEAALQAALNYVGANTYKWELPEEEVHLKFETNNPAATYQPHGELKYVSSAIELNPAELKLTYKFNIYAQDPLSRQEIYVDATNGQIVFTNNLIHTANSQGTAVTAYSGTQTFTTDSLSPTSYRLRSTGRGNGIFTYDLQRGTNYNNFVDFTDADNVWNNVNANRDEYATDAQWGSEGTYDYYFSKFNRNSINNNGFALVSYLHYSVNFNNAFWDGQRMTYGDGNANTTPLCALDVASHEVTHGLTTFTANLIYANESGALNESFSDIFGTAVEFFHRPSRANWTIGEDIGFAFRSMSNPNSRQNPDTYNGTFWTQTNATGGCTPTQQNDQCGVHNNSGVQNFWFYLLSQGGTGTNDNGDAYSVTGVGIDTAATIAYRNLVVYLTQSSNFADARFYSIQSASDLYGECSPIYQSVVNAWHAVGVGNAYTPGVNADFIADVTSACIAPLSVQFANNSDNAATFTWDFGDGTTSTLREPSHNYTAMGQYDVKLIADGGACGIDSLTRVAYIDIDTANACVVILQDGANPMQTECTGKLYDTGGPNGDYANNEDAVITIAPTNAATVTLNFASFDVEAGAPGTCNFDDLEVFDGPTINDPSLGVFCNNNMPTSLTSTASSVTIRFTSDGLVTESGFEIDWQCNSATSAPIAEFSSSTTSTCDGAVLFEDLSTQLPTSWSWDFGDGITSTLENPMHTYATNGTYTVSLTATNAFGTNTITKSNLITVNRPAAPTASNMTGCQGASVTLTASNTVGTVNWYDAPIGGNIVATGSSNTVNNLTNNTTFWVADDVIAPIQNVGAANNAIGTGANFNNDIHHLKFNVLDRMELVSVVVYAGSSATRTIELRDNNGNVLQSLTRFIPSGAFRVQLNFTIDPGTDYELGVASGSTLDLFRNNSGTNYPYTIANLVSITRSSAGTNPTGFYYFFYNWEVKGIDCSSARTAVTAMVDTSCTVTGINDLDLLEEQISVYPNPATDNLFISNESGEQINSLEVMNITGKLILTPAVNFSGNTTKLNLDGISSGVYFVRINTASGVLTRKFIIR